MKKILIVTELAEKFLIFLAISLVRLAPIPPAVPQLVWVRALPTSGLKNLKKLSFFGFFCVLTFVLSIITTSSVFANNYGNKIAAAGYGSASGGYGSTGGGYNTSGKGYGSSNSTKNSNANNEIQNNLQKTNDDIQQSLQSNVEKAQQLQKWLDANPKAAQELEQAIKNSSEPAEAMKKWLQDNPEQALKIQQLLQN